MTSNSRATKLRTSEIAFCVSRLASVYAISPISGYVSAWRMNSILKI